MFVVDQLERFRDWFAGLRDPIGRKQIAKRIVFMEAGHFGDFASVGGRVTELRIHSGPGYRVYFTRKGEHLILLLVGGDKATQVRDIADAKALAAMVHDDD